MKTQKIITLILLLVLFSFINEIEGKLLGSVERMVQTIKQRGSFEFTYSFLDLSDHFKATKTKSRIEFIGN